MCERHERKDTKMRHSKYGPIISPEPSSYPDEPFISKAIAAYSEEFHDLNARMTDESRRLMIDYIHQNPLKPFSDWISKARELLSTQAEHCVVCGRSHSFSTPCDRPYARTRVRIPDGQDEESVSNNEDDEPTTVEQITRENSG